MPSTEPASSEDVLTQDELYLIQRLVDERPEPGDIKFCIDLISNGYANKCKAILDEIATRYIQKTPRQNQASSSSTPPRYHD